MVGDLESGVQYKTPAYDTKGIIITAILDWAKEARSARPKPVKHDSRKGASGSCNKNSITTRRLLSHDQSYDIEDM